jgi:hypothetical protein
MEVPTPTGAIFSLAKAVIKHHDHLLPLLRSYRFAYRKKIRVSMACLIRLEHEGCYVLARNRHRPEFLSPFGGVFKYHEDAQPILDEIFFERDPKASKDKDLRNDLRGRFPAQHFGSFMTWFKSRIGREQSETVKRELAEEVVENNVPSSVASRLLHGNYTLCRTIHEGPYAHHGLPYVQFRYFEIYGLVMNGEAETTMKDLAEFAKTPQSLIQLVSTSEINELRTELGQAIAGTAQYFYRSAYPGFEPRPF